MYQVMDKNLGENRKSYFPNVKMQHKKANSN